MKDYRVAPLDVLAPPPEGWVTVTTENHSEIATKIPAVSAGENLNENAEHACNHLRFKLFFVQA